MPLPIKTCKKQSCTRQLKPLRREGTSTFCCEMGPDAMNIPPPTPPRILALNGKHRVLRSYHDILP